VRNPRRRSVAGATEGWTEAQNDDTPPERGASLRSVAKPSRSFVPSARHEPQQVGIEEQLWEGSGTGVP